MKLLTALACSRNITAKLLASFQALLLEVVDLATKTHTLSVLAKRWLQQPGLVNTAQEIDHRLIGGLLKSIEKELAKC